MIEMLVVLGIIALVTAMTLPMIVPIMRTRTLDSAVDTVKSACNLARSTAIQQRRMMNLTFLQQTDAYHGPGIVLTGYNYAGIVTTSGTINTFTDINQTWNCSFQNCQVLLFSAGTPTPQQRTIQGNTNNTIGILPNSVWSPSVSYGLGNMVSNGGIGYICIADNIGSPPPSPNWQCLSWNPQPAAGNVYVILSSASPAQPYCIHYRPNYNNGSLANKDVRFLVLKTFSQYMGQTIQYLPTGCQFDFGPTDTGVDNGTYPSNAWTYVFLPNGEVWTLTPQAQDLRDTNWFLTTYMYNGVVSGPKIWGPQNLTSATITVYATTGQVVSK